MRLLKMDEVYALAKMRPLDLDDGVQLLCWQSERGQQAGDLAIAEIDRLREDEVDAEEMPFELQKKDAAALGGKPVRCWACPAVGQGHCWTMDAHSFAASTFQASIAAPLTA